MGLRFLEENDQRILRQKHLIDKLKAAKLDTTRAGPLSELSSRRKSSCSTTGSSCKLF
jgi:hypothetical protein